MSRIAPADLPLARPADPPALPRAVRPVPVFGPVPRSRGFLIRTVRGVGSVAEWAFGILAVIVGLAVLAGLPVLQFLSLGYLLEAGGRVARTGRLRDGFIGVRTAARLGGIFVAGWLFVLPTRLVADMARSAAIIDPGGSVTERWRIGLMLMIAATIAHVGLAVARGGRLRYFLWPFNGVWFVRRLLRGGFYTEARNSVWGVVAGLRLPYYFWLGVRGFAAAFAWLVIPVTMIAVGRVGSPGAVLLGFVGAAQLAVVLVYLPFLQLRLAETNRFRGAFEVGTVRAAFGRAPWAFAASLFVTLLFAVPLYLLKIEVVPREAAWLPGLIFIAFIYPARLVTGWALRRANRRGTPRHGFWRWTGRLTLLPIAGVYVLIVYFTQFTSWNGVGSLYEQHAFLLPVPFFGM